MKKIVLVLLLFFIKTWADEKQLYDSLDYIISEPYRYWHLTVSPQNYIVKSNTIERVYYRIVSLFSRSHKDKLEKALKSLINEMNKYSRNALNDKETIISNKICSLVSQKKEGFWFDPIDVSVLSCQQMKWKYFQESGIENHDLIRPTWRDGCFFNFENEEMIRTSIVEVAVFIRSIFTSSSSINLDKLVQQDPVLPSSKKLNVQWMGHSSFLIQIDEINILVDPVTEAFHPIFGGLVKCFKRYIKPGIALKDLPKIDVVLISHNHLDHLEDKALFYLKRFQPQILVPKGLKKYFDNKGFKNVKEHNWWDKTIAKSEKDGEVIFACVPAWHNSMGRGNVNRRESLWSGWVIEGKEKHIYFAGDTAFNGAMFRQIKEEFYPIDLALLPVAPDKMWIRHIDHLEALRTLNILEGKIMIPMHWGAYRTGDEKIEEPYLKMKKEKEENPKFNGRIKILKIGQRYQES